MLPKQHAIYGAIFSLLVYMSFNFTVAEVLIIFAASVLIDFDHYLIYVLRERNLNLKKAYSYFLKGTKQSITKKQAFEPLTVFHTIEFILLLIMVSSVYDYLIFVAIGFIFHTLVDYYEMWKDETLFMRTHSIIRYFLKKNKQ